MRAIKMPLGCSADVLNELRSVACTNFWQVRGGCTQDASEPCVLITEEVKGLSSGLWGGASLVSCPGDATAAFLSARLLDAWKQQFVFAGLQACCPGCQIGQALKGFVTHAHYLPRAARHMVQQVLVLLQAKLGEAGQFFLAPF